ncbi:hypothetical protein BH10PSE17_BH10PSE17_36200 [soil metagenome]
MKKIHAAEDVTLLEQIPNIGSSIAEDLRSLGISTPAALKRADPQGLYDRLCRLTGERQDPCVLDTFVAAVDFMNGAPSKPWWHYSRKRLEAE